MEGNLQGKQRARAKYAACKANCVLCKQREGDVKVQRARAKHATCKASLQGNQQRARPAARKASNTQGEQCKDEEIRKARRLKHAHMAEKKSGTTNWHIFLDNSISPTLR
jgi:hypothetical protein